jgi:hypothetical protein
VFRIGHLGDFNDLALMGTLCGVEMGLAAAGVPHRAAGVKAAMDYLAGAQADNLAGVQADNLAGVQADDLAGAPIATDRPVVAETEGRSRR